MIDTNEYITDAQLLGAFDSGPMKMSPADSPMGSSFMAAGAESCRRVAEIAIAAYIGRTVPGRNEILERIAHAVERIAAHTGALENE